MAYSRFFESDIYIYPHVEGYVYCCACLLSKYGESVIIRQDDELVSHIAQHKAAEHEMPTNLLDIILKDPDRYNKSGRNF